MTTDRAAHHKQWWCDHCEEGSCNGDHFVHTRVSSMGGGDADTNHDAGAVIPYIAVGAGWVEWERSHCLPGVYIEVSGPGHAYVDLAEALKMRMALDEAIEAVRGLLVGDHHLLCDCTVDQTVGVDGD